MREKMNKNIAGLISIAVLVPVLLYLAGIIAQLMININAWKAAGSNYNVSPGLPSLNFLDSLGALFSFPEGPIAIGAVLVGVALICVFGLRLGWGERGTMDRERNLTISSSGSYGTAAFMTDKEAEACFDITTCARTEQDILGTTAGGKVFTLPRNTRLNANMAICGASGTGKSRSISRNLILQAARRNESVIITDCKSELYDSMSEYLRKQGYIVKVLNLIEMEHSDSWNCLGEVGSSELMAQTFSDIVLSNTTGDDRDAFWYNAELNLLKALVLYVSLEMPPEKRNFGTVYDMLVNETDKSLKQKMLAIRNARVDPETGEVIPPSPAFAPFSIFMQSSETVRTSVIIGLGSKLQVMQAQQVKNITSYDEIDLELPGKRKCAYFCIVSDQDNTFEFLSTLFFSFLFIRLIRYADSRCEGNTFVLDVIQKSKTKQKKSICFVTGVPGAGKTLVGLDVAIKQTYQGQKEPIKDEGAVYLSGNGPLVAVLTEALAQDNYKKAKANKESKKLSDSRREVSKSIQMIHRYRDNMLAKIKNPVENGVLEIDPEKAVKMEKAGFGEVEHVAIFDEAQRSWTHKRLADYLKRGGTYGNKLKVPNFPLSEAAFLIWSLDQREDWATIVCLVGGGQEINTGEAGISEWLKALNEFFPHWDVYISPQLTEAEYAEGKVNELLRDNQNVTFSESLHLGVSLRSFRAEKLSAFVHAMLSFDKSAAALYEEIKDKYPIVLTRDINTAKKWLHDKVRGTERTGVLVSKESARFKPLSMHILPPGDENAVHWFLEDKTDTRSSNYLEDAATEIQVQGLELDYTCLLWDADMRYEDGKWNFYRFNGQTKWIEQSGSSESKQELRKYMLNAYRVLLTRARLGMVICVPVGNPNKTVSGFWEDSTRLPEYYDGTYLYLKSLGIQEI